MNPHELERQYRRLGFWAIVAVVLVLVAFVLRPFADALLWAVILSVLTYPLYKRLCGRFNEAVSALLTILSTLILVAIPLGLVGLMAFIQFRGVVEDFEPRAVESRVIRDPSPVGISLEPTVANPETAGAEKPAAPEAERETTFTNIAKRVDEAAAPIRKQLNVNFKLEDYVREHGPEIVRSVTGPMTRAAAQTAVGAVMLVVSFLTMFFMLKEGHKLLQPAKELLPLPEERTQRILERIQKTIHAVFMGVILVAFIQGVLAAIAYFFAGIDAWLVWGAASMVLCAIPLLGAPVIYIPLSLMLIGQGKTVEGIALLIFGFVVISNVDNFLRPKYIGERVGLHYIAIFFSLLGGVLAFGPVGLMAGPIILTILLELIDYARTTRSEAQSKVMVDAENAGDAA